MDPAFNCTFTMCSCPSTLQKEFISKDKKQDGTSGEEVHVTRSVFFFSSLQNDDYTGLCEEWKIFFYTNMIMLYTLSYSKNKTDLRIVKQLQYIYVSVHICVYIQEYSTYYYYILQYIHQ